MDRWKETFAETAFRRSADTAHDLKTPLNVAVLNLELLRMRVRKLLGEDDAKILGYAAAIELELRRMARIFDAFFVNVVPPPEEGQPVETDLSEIARAEAERRGIPLAGDAAQAPVLGHPARIREMVRLLFEGASASLRPKTIRAAGQVEQSEYRLRISGKGRSGELDFEKVFKLYYTDPSGNPDLSLATVRLILETYGGAVAVRRDGEQVVLEISMPLR